MRLLQTQGQAPALAGPQLGLRLVQEGLVLKVAVPAQRQPRRQLHRLTPRGGASGQLCLFDLEHEAGAGRAGLRHRGHDASDQQVPALQRRGQSLGQAQLGAQAGEPVGQRASAGQRTDQQQPADQPLRAQRARLA